MRPNRQLANKQYTRRPVSRLISRSLKALMICGLLSAGLSGCFFMRDQESDAETTATEVISVPSDIENPDTNVRITVPSGWSAVRGQQRLSADIYAVHSEKQLYAAVVSEQADGLDRFSLENNAEQYRWLIRQELDRFEGEMRTGVTTVDGDPALQYEIRGQVNGVPVVYLHTTIEGRDRYYQVVGWTTADSYQENEGTLQGIINSFRGA